jgi:hypothetical protein
MKSTIKLDTCHSISIEPAAGDVVKVSLCTGFVPMIQKTLSRDAAGALIFALEQALEENETKAGRVPAQQCNGNCNQGRNCTCGVPV